MVQAARAGSGPPLAGSIAAVLQHQTRRWRLELADELRRRFV
jgi:hypothetical protein